MLQVYQEILFAMMCRGTWLRGIARVRLSEFCLRNWTAIQCDEEYDCTTEIVRLRLKRILPNRRRILEEAFDVLPVVGRRAVCQSIAVRDKADEAWVVVSVAYDFFVPFVFVDSIYVIRSEVGVPNVVVQDPRAVHLSE